MKNIFRFFLVALFVIVPTVAVRAETISSDNTCRQSSPTELVSCLTVQMLKLQIQLLTMQLNALLQQQSHMVVTPVITTQSSNSTTGSTQASSQTHAQVCTTAEVIKTPLAVEQYVGGGHVGDYYVNNTTNGTIHSFASTTDGYKEALNYAQQYWIIDPVAVKTVCQSQGTATPSPAPVCTTTGTKIPLTVKTINGGGYGVFDKNGSIIWDFASSTDAYQQAQSYAQEHGVVDPNTMRTVCN